MGLGSGAWIMVGSGTYPKIEYHAYNKAPRRDHRNPNVAFDVRRNPCRNCSKGNEWHEDSGLSVRLRYVILPCAALVAT